MFRNPICLNQIFPCSVPAILGGHIIKWIIGLLKKYTWLHIFDPFRITLAIYPGYSALNLESCEKSQWSENKMRNVAKVRPPCFPA